MLDIRPATSRSMSTVNSMLKSAHADAAPVSCIIVFLSDSVREIRRSAERRKMSRFLGGGRRFHAGKEDWAEWRAASMSDVEADEKLWRRSAVAGEETGNDVEVE